MKRIYLILCLLLSMHTYATEKWEIFELSMKGPKVENPFTDINVRAEFKYKNYSYYVDGFYDGNQTYKIRFMPLFEGEWNYSVHSDSPAIKSYTGTFTCTPPKADNHGPVSVRDTFHFVYADGRPYYPIGTTAYAWVHQEKKLIQETLETLGNHTFNKIRMTVMPKYYGRYVSNEPPHYPYEGSQDSGWDRKRFNVEFFQHLEKQVDALKDLNIEADIILFHPYDKWGFDEGSIEENRFYLKYLVARLAAYRNVWWSMANEYDIMNKPDSEWKSYFEQLLLSDPYSHLKSIHNGKGWYNHSLPWITHLSVQTPFLEKTQQWRETYHKPVINDEFVYEGNVPFDWGNLTAEETVNRFWTMYCRGGYASHGETYRHPENILWWAKGGKLYGKSPDRLAFLHKIMREAPRHGLQPIHTAWNKETYLFKNDSYFLYYYGNSQQASALLKLSEDKNYTLEIIDAWNMTIEELPEVYHGVTEIELPQRPYIAVRARSISSH
ncbi:DUF5060 domain-containing protein [Pareuzebyella sediminis]|uniref:DUF5060 domain-containing protein n=1 Tax=Pareuzebyella sediminis TaxID=2607998 RepID=UPI0018E15E49|nr:DUF5060 domain-containing protein [Pareuzebyella sediminis]